MQGNRFQRIKEDKKILRIGGVIAKYGFSLLLLILSLKTTRNPVYLFWGAAELAVVFLVSNFLISKHRACNLLQALFLLLYNAEVLVLLFGGGFISLVMLQNLASLKDLGGKAFIYGCGVVFVLAVSFFPTHPIERKPLLSAGVIAVPVWAVCFEIWLLSLAGAGSAPAVYTPSAGLYDLCRQYSEYQELQRMMEQYASLPKEEPEKEEPKKEEPVRETEEKPQETQESLKEPEREEPRRTQEPEEPQSAESEEELFQRAVADLTDYSESVHDVDHIAVPAGTNVILIFAEGMSKNILTDARNIMPNVAAFERQCISFQNYYDHSFATYRGLQGQLFSGHNNNELDSNSLVSLEDLFREAGYRTAFINTEPNNEDFTAYLNALHFDTVVNGQKEDFFVPDAEAYQLLYDTAEQYHSAGTPFFLSIYTFQTHASWDSSDQIFGDGTERVLNRFYNADYHFGQFFQKFMDSAMRDDTMIVFTSDHCTFADEDFVSAFPGYRRPCQDVDTIPLMMYYRGNAQTVDAKGRNALDMAPTLLELLGMNAPKTFLGNSLFQSKLDDKLDCYFWDPVWIMYTGNNAIEAVDADTKKKVMTRLAQYFAIK